MNAPQTCPKCGAPLSADAPEGLCPACLMSGGIATGAATVKLNPSQKPGGPEPVSTPAPEELAPLFPQLEILELLGRGGMGAVYKARQKHLNRFVALKILPVDANADPHFAERFQREAQALAKLSHPNIVGVFDFGVSEGLFYFLMEFVDGANLRTLIQGGEMKPEAALALIPAFCDALQFAHDEGVVHRDIKPENVLVDKKGRVKIADFGLAKLLGHDMPGDTLTRTGMHLGTPRYMAPEQFDKPETVDHRADIYSLGVVFYEMLTGELPMGRFAPPSHKVQVDVKLDEIVLRSLERDVERRYQHASEIKTDVQGVTAMAGAASSAPPRQAESKGAEDVEEDDEENHPLYQRLWSIVPVVAVVLAFYNPWGAKAWYGFAAGCAILALLPGIGIGRRKALRSQPANESADDAKSPTRTITPGATGAEGAAKPLSRFHGLQTFGLLLLGWLVVGALWNYGTPGCVAGALVLGAITVEAALRLFMQKPKARQMWQSARPWKRVYLVGGYVALAVIPFMLMISALDVKWEISPLRSSVSAQSKEAFEAAHKGREYQLIRDLQAFKQEVPTTELVLRGFNWHGGWQIWGSSGPYEGLFGWTSILASLCAVTLILGFLIQQVVGAEKISAWHIAAGGWRPAIRLTLLVLASAVTAFAVLNVLFVLSGPRSSPRHRSMPVTTTASVSQVQIALQKWAAENGYARGDDRRWELASVPRGQTVAQIAQFSAWKPSPYERWRMTSAGLRQMTPHVTVLIVGTEKPVESQLTYRVEMRQLDDSDKEHVEHVLNSLFNAVTWAGSIDVNKPLEEQINRTAVAAASKGVSPWWLLFGVIGVSASWAAIRHGRPARAPGVPSRMSSQPVATTGDARLSPFARAGAICLGLSVLAALGILGACISVMMGSHETSGSRTAGQIPSGAIVIYVLGIAIALLAVAATILGGLGIAQIKRSGGKFRGLGLAALDFLCYPLLLVGVLSCFAGMLACFSLGWLCFGFLGFDDGPVVAPLCVLTGVLVAPVGCFFTGRAAWRRIAGRVKTPVVPGVATRRGEAWWFRRSRKVQKLMHLILGAIFVLSLIAFFSFSFKSTAMSSPSRDPKHAFDLTIGLGDPWFYLCHHKAGSARGSAESGLNLAADSAFFGYAALLAGISLVGLARELRRRRGPPVPSDAAPQRRFLAYAIAGLVLFVAGSSRWSVHESRHHPGPTLMDARKLHPDFTHPGSSSLALKKAAADEMNLTPRQLEQVNRALNRHYLEFLKLENEHTTYRKRAGYVSKDIKPFPERSFALARRLVSELRQIAGQEIIPEPERGAVWKLRLFHHAGEFGVHASLSSERGKYSCTETWTHDGRGTYFRPYEDSSDIKSSFGPYRVDWTAMLDVAESKNSYTDLTRDWDTMLSALKQLHHEEIAEILAADSKAVLKSADPHATLVAQAGTPLGRSSAVQQLELHGIAVPKEATAEDLVKKLEELMGQVDP